MRAAHEQHVQFSVSVDVVMVMTGQMGTGCPATQAGHSLLADYACMLEPCTITWYIMSSIVLRAQALQDPNGHVPFESRRGDPLELGSVSTTTRRLGKRLHWNMEQKREHSTNRPCLTQLLFSSELINHPSREYYIQGEVLS